jgi:hypothetical protein
LHEGAENEQPVQRKDEREPNDAGDEITDNGTPQQKLVLDELMRGVERVARLDEHVGKLPQRDKPDEDRQQVERAASLVLYATPEIVVFEGRLTL